jgi:hypothetical protein|tara:strand:+ start:1060 stop:1491 length:432 start_codon:yes stop_codon:yes gene_type:complete
MASNHKHPENDIAWFIVGDKLAITTTKGTDSTSVHSKSGDWKAIDEAVTNGVLIHYYAEPNTVDSLDDYPDLDNSMHASIIEYVKSKLYIDKAGTSNDPNTAATAMNMSMVHEKSWRDSMVKFGSRRRDKIGGTRVVKTFDLR